VEIPRAATAANPWHQKEPAHDGALGVRLWFRPMDKPQQHKPLTGWRAGLAATVVPLNLGKHSATSKGRRLTGEELEQAKRRLMERYSAKSR
jgi:hypothetical protein